MVKKKLTSLLNLFQKSFQIFSKKENFWYAAKFGLIFLVLNLANLGINNLTGGTYSDLSSPLVLLVFLVRLILFVLSTWATAAGISAIPRMISGNLLGVKKTFSETWQLMQEFVSSYILRWIVLFVGLLFLVVPGLVFGVWFYFASMFIVFEGSGAAESLKKSKKLVSGYFWPTLGRIAVFGLLYFLVILLPFNKIPAGGGAIFSMLIPYLISLNYLLYVDLKRVKA